MYISFLTYATSLHAAEPDWALIPRHGECHDIAQALRHRFDNLPPISSPHDFLEAMRAQGISAHTSREPGLGDDAFIVEVPGRGMTLLFVRRHHCAEFVERGTGQKAA